MQRRSFLKFLAIAPLAPKVAIDVISKIEPPLLIHPKFIYGKVTIDHEAHLRAHRKIMADIMVKHFRQQQMVYARFCADVSYFKTGKGKGYHFDVKPAHKR